MALIDPSPLHRNCTLRICHVFGSKCNEHCDSVGPYLTAHMQFDKGLHCLPIA